MWLFQHGNLRVVIVLLGRLLPTQNQWTKTSKQKLYDLLQLSAGVIQACLPYCISWSSYKPTHIQQKGTQTTPIKGRRNSGRVCVCVCVCVMRNRERKRRIDSISIISFMSIKAVSILFLPTAPNRHVTKIWYLAYDQKKKQGWALYSLFPHPIELNHYNREDSLYQEAGLLSPSEV
jgi:hypothetical protein